MKKPTLRHVAVALVMLVAFLVQGTWALAGTTGGLSGLVTDEKGAPVVAATVTVTAPSGTSTTLTDASGHYVFLTLAPDTYTVSVKKDGYNPVSQGGATVFADQTHTVDLHTEHSIKEIGHVTSRAANDLVKSGTTADIYSVNAATAEKVASIGGGANLNNAYSALQSQPGVMMDYGGIGWGQTIYIHGASYSQVGYEFDGIPVNRAFDNYNANTLTNLGQQELQVYTGGAPASSSSATVGGFINQVIRTGTYPGFGTANAAFAAPSYYHALQGEAGGATPNRLFSYYVGLLGYDQVPRFNDQFSGGLTPGFNIAPTISTGPTDSLNPGGIFGVCNSLGVAPPANPGGCVGLFPFALAATTLVQDRESVANFHIGIPHKKDSGRDDVQLLYSGSYQHQSYADSINDYGGQNNACNLLAIGCANNPPVTPPLTVIPWADATFFNNNASFGQTLTPNQTVPLINYFFPSSPTNRPLNAPLPFNQRAGQNNDSQIIKVQYTHNIGSNAYIRAYGYTFYSDWLLNDPTVAELVYKLGNGYFGSTPDYELITHTKGGSIQYANQINSQHLLQADINYVTANVSRYNNSSFRVGDVDFPGSSGAGCYRCGTNLIQLDGSGNPILDGRHCVNPAGALRSCFDRHTQAPFWDPTLGGTTVPGATWVVTNLGPAGTLNKVTPKFGSFSVSDQWRPNDKLLINLGIRGDRFEYDLTPTSGADFKFWFAAGANSFCYDPAAGNFAALQFVKIGGAAVPGAQNLVTTAPGAACPNSPITGTPMLHPNGSTAPGSGNPVGTNPLLYSNQTDATYTIQRLEPRLSGTYTQSPDTVWRFSAGQYVNPFNTATAEYIDASPKRAAYFDFQSFFGLGFTSPQHKVQPTTSTNYDISLERRIRGTDVSFKVSPFYRDVHNQTQDSFIGPGFVSAIPTNNERAWGVELQINKGDPNKNGLSGQLSYTWTRADSKFNPIGPAGTNFIDNVNGAVGAYNALTRAASGTSYTLSTGQRITLGAAAPCYYNGQGFGTGFAPITTPFGVLGPADCVVSGNSILMSPLALGGGTSGTSAVQNPYFFLNPQGYFDPAGRYPLYQTFPNIFEAFPDPNMTIIWPQVISGFLNYKHNKFSITPNFQLIYGYSGGSNGGGAYGSPLAVLGLDPRGCQNNQSSIAGTDTPQLPAYLFVLPNGNLGCGGSTFGSGFLYVPNPYTGSFDGFGKYQNPWLFNLNMQMSYEITPKIKASLLLANIYNRCFGGSNTPWSTFSPPGSTVCGYDSNFGSTYAGAPGLTPPGTGFFLGSSPTHPVNGPVWNQASTFYPYSPLTSFLPFTAYLSLQFKI